jgi:TPR repeat protein
MASEYYQRAADGNLATVQNEDAFCLQNGRGVKIDLNLIGAAK